MVIAVRETDRGVSLRCVHRWKLQPSEEAGETGIVGVCKTCGASKLFNRQLQYKYPEVREVKGIKREVALEEFLDRIAPRHTEDRMVKIRQRPFAGEWHKPTY